MTMQRIGWGLTLLLIVVAALGDRIAPNSAAEQFPDRAWAPPMRVHVEGRGLVTHRLLLSDRLSRAFIEDRSRTIELDLFSRGRLVSAAPGEPVLLLGADALGRDVLARVAGATRWSLGVAVAGALLAMLIGTLLGALAAGGGHVADRLVMSTSTALATLPAVYIVLTVRAALPLVMSPAHVFLALTLLFGFVGWPMTAWGVRTILARERVLDYAMAARAAGASRARLMFVHLLPAARGFLLTQFLIFVPGFLISEVSLSYLGLGFPEPTPSWGSMLQDASNVRVIAEAPWMLAPAAAVAFTSIALHLSAGAAGARPGALTVFSRAR